MKKHYVSLAICMVLFISGCFMVSSALGANGGEVTDGQSFVDALGGSECAEYRVEDGVTVVTLKSDVEPVGVIEIQ